MIKTLTALGMASALLMAAPAAMAANTAPVPAVTSADRVLGRADAPVTVIEYASFTCSHCANWHNEVLPQFKTRFIDTGKVRLVFRDLPTAPAQVAATAAGVARCAAPGKFFDVARSFMSKQSEAFASGNLMEWFTAAITASGHSQDEIEACLTKPETSESLNKDVEAAVAAGVTGTPSFFVNGRKVADPSLETLSAAIDPLLQGR